MRWRRAAMAWAVAACGCSFEDIEIRLAMHDAATQSDAATVVQRSCAAPAPRGCGRARVTGGTFRMGDPAAFDVLGTDGHAVPLQQRISISAFMLDRFEVTVGRFRRFVDAERIASGFAARHASKTPHCNWTASPEDREEHPMNCVDHATAGAFCRWDTVGGGLPTEAQWEYAARGQTNRIWPWGGAEGPIPE